MRDALNSSGRHIFFSMCQWGQENPWTWASSVGNSWRTTGDINGLYNSMLSILDKQKGLSEYAKPGAWNDPDMLEVGNSLMTHDEYQTHFAFWSALKAPLLIGCNLKGITQSTLSILGNEEVIAVNQDPLGKQADFLIDEKSVSDHREVWGGELSNNKYVLICFNRFLIETVFTLHFDKLFPGKKVISIREIIEKKND
jgi:alpha-galactosidase